MTAPHGDPEWLITLRTLRRQAGTPTLQDMSYRTGIPKASLGNTFSGKAKPNRDRYIKLVGWFTDDQNQLDEALVDYDTDFETERRTYRSEHRRHGDEPSADARHIADAILKAAEIIAAAIRDEAPPR